jgi:hypothetical protein
VGHCNLLIPGPDLGQAQVANKGMQCNNDETSAMSFGCKETNNIISKALEAIGFS